MTLGFLDKLKGKKDDSAMPPPPPPPMPGAGASAKPAAAPMPKQPVTAKEPLPPLPATMPKAAPTPAQSTHPASMPPPVVNTSLPQPKPGASPAKDTRDHVRAAFQDVPPITVDPNKPRKEVITDQHAADLDIDKLVLPDEAPPPAPAQPVHAPAPHPQSKPLPELNSPQIQAQSPFPIQEAAAPVHVPHSNRPTPPPVARPKPTTPPGHVVPSPMPTPEALPALSPTDMHATTGPLFVDVSTYEFIQERFTKMHEQVKSLTDDAKLFDRLKDQEDKDLAQITSRLEEIQEELIKLDEELFVNK